MGPFSVVNALAAACMPHLYVYPLDAFLRRYPELEGCQLAPYAVRPCSLFLLAPDRTDAAHAGASVPCELAINSLSLTVCTPPSRAAERRRTSPTNWLCAWPAAKHSILFG